MSDRVLATESADDFLVEDVRNEPETAMAEERAAVGGCDARPLLPAMLERVETEVGKVGSLGACDDSDDAALLSIFVEKDLAQVGGSPRRPVGR